MHLYAGVGLKIFSNQFSAGCWVGVGVAMGASPTQGFPRTSGMETWPPQAPETFPRPETGPFPDFRNFLEARFSPSQSLCASPALTWHDEWAVWRLLVEEWAWPTSPSDYRFGKPDAKLASSLPEPAESHSCLYACNISYSVA